MLYAYLTTRDDCARVPTGVECSSAECRAETARQDRADQARHDQEAIDRAVAAGVIDP